MEFARRAISEFRDFLERPPEGPVSWCKLIFSTLIFSICWVVISGFLMGWIVPSGTFSKQKDLWAFFLIAAAGEEALFRWFPLTVLLLFSRSKPIGLMVFCALFSSICFGLAHIHNYPPEISVGWAAFCSLLLQGWLGFVWSLVFIKCSSKKSTFQLLPMATTTIIHFSYNMVIVYARIYL